MALFSMRDSWNVWRRKVNAALGGLTEPVKAEDVTYDNTDSGLTATNVQSAVDEVAGDLSGLSGAEVSYDGTESGLSATNVQGAIDEVNAKPVQLGTIIATPEASATIPTATFTPVASVELQAGTYLILGHVRFDVGTGQRIINIGVSGWNGTMDNVSAIQGGYTTSNSWIIVTVASTTTYYLNVYQDSGADLTVNAIRLEAIKIK